MTDKDAQIKLLEENQYRLIKMLARVCSQYIILYDVVYNDIPDSVKDAQQLIEEIEGAQ